LILSLFFINLVSAIQVYQITDIHNKTFENYLSVYQGEMDNTDNLRLEGKPIEFYFTYSNRIGLWNTYNKNYQVDYCNYTVYFIDYNSAPNTTTSLYSEILTNSSPFTMKKRFIQMDKRQGATSFLRCYYNSTLLEDDYTGATQDVVFASDGCRAKQLEINAQVEFELESIDLIKRNRQLVVGYIFNILGYILENIVALFWLFSFFLLLGSVGLVFFAGIWLYRYIRSLTK
jgi:hypothetical protein